MFGKNFTTLIFIGNKRIARFDCTRSGKRLGSWFAGRAAGTDLAGLVEIALRLGGKRPGRVWIVASDFWIQKITLSLESIQGLQPAEAARALAFEAESLSGISALDSEVAYRETLAQGKDREYWLIQIPNWLHDQLESAVQGVGGKLSGLAHPGGLPEPLATTPGGYTAQKAWLRVEAWPGAILAIGAKESGQLQHYIVHADSRAPGWRANFDAWAAAWGTKPAIEHLTDGGLELQHFEKSSAFRLDEESVLEAWLARWGALLAAGTEAVPVLRPPKQPLSKGTRQAITLSLAAAALIACGVDRWIVTSRNAAIDSELKSIKQLTTTMEGEKKQEADLRKRLADENKIIAGLKSQVVFSQSVLSNYRSRWPRLLETLARVSPDDVAIREISDRGGTTFIHGTSLSSAGADQLASALSKELQPFGWTVSPAEKTVNNSLPDRELCQFTLELHEAAIPAPATVGQIIAGSPPQPSTSVAQQTNP